MQNAIPVRLITVAAICATFAACSDSREYAYDDSLSARTDTTTTISGGAITSEEWSDGGILGQISLANGAELAALELAHSRATSTELEKLAERIEHDYQDMNSRLQELASRMNVAPAIPSDSSALEDINDDIADLQEKDRGAEWDEEFVDDLVDWEQGMRDLLTRASQETQNAELRQMLADGRSTIDQHISDAKALEQKLD
jgi:predicted outer membrane protein